MEKNLAVGGHKIAMSDRKNNFDKCNFSVNAIVFEKVASELIINACKFSKKNTTIMILMESDNDQLSISFLNEPLPSKDGIVGVPLEYENAVFDPFFRMTSFVYEEYNTIDFGLGLTYVDQAVVKHKGTVRIFNINDHSNLAASSTLKVNVQIKIPGSNVTACEDND